MLELVGLADSLEVAPVLVLVSVPTPEAPALASEAASEPGPEEVVTREQHHKPFSVSPEER